MDAEIVLRVSWATCANMGLGIIDRPSKCLSHHNHRLCKVFLAGVNLLLQIYGFFVVNTLFGRIFTLFLCKCSRK